MQQQIRGRIRKMSAAEISDDNVLVKKIVEKHKPDEGTEYDVKPLLELIEDVLGHIFLSSEDAALMTSLAHTDHVEEDKSYLPHVTNMLEALSPKIDRISCEISYKTLNGVDAHSKTIELFDMLTMFKWDVKIVLALAAFVQSYGEFRLLAQIHDTNQFARSMAILKQLSSILEHANSLKPRFDTLNDLVKNILEVSKCAKEFHDLPTLEIPAYTTAYNYIPVASYWTIRSIVACAAQITSLTKIFPSTETQELSLVTFKIKSIIDHLRLEIDSLHEYYRIQQTEMISTGRTSKMEDDSTRVLFDLFSKPHIDNMKVLKALINAEDGILPLYDGVTKRRVSLELLRRKTVLLLFSGIEISIYELVIIEQILTESKAMAQKAHAPEGHAPSPDGDASEAHVPKVQAPRMESRYELVWVPIVDPNSEWTGPKHKQFEELKELMKCYSVCHPFLIGKPVIRFIQREWKYKNKPIIVVLDPQGRVSSPNAIYMMWIWGSAAYPFTSSREEALWREETWRLELLVDGIDQQILNWIRDGKYIFLYGGDGPEWVRGFVKEARKVATHTQISLEMIYVGKSNKEEQVQNIIDTIIREKLDTQYWRRQELIWFFWNRLEKMLFSKLQSNEANDDDLVMKEINKLMIDDQHGGWVILAKGSNIVVSGDATTGLQTLMEYAMWEENAKRDGFELSFKSHYDKILSVVGPCFRIEFSQTIERMSIPGPLLMCPECHGNMRMRTTFQCCHDEKLDEDFFATTLKLPTI